MQPVANEQLLRQLNWRYATKKFDPAKRIPDDAWRTLEQALVLTPSSFGLQPWKFIVVTDPAVRRDLVAISWKQTQPLDCSHFVVFTARSEMAEADIDRLIQRTAELRGVSPESLAGYRKMMLGTLVTPRDGFDVRNWAALQCYIALGNFMTAAAMLGVDTCPMEGIEPAKYDELFGLAKEGYRTVVACAAGYRAADDKYATLPKIRFPAEQLIRHI